MALSTNVEMLLYHLSKLLFYLIYILVPVAGVPENITVTPASSTSLNVSWNHPGDNVVGYIVHYQPTGN